jgi:hypothetical protein
MGLSEESESKQQTESTYERPGIIIDVTTDSPEIGLADEEKEAAPNKSKTTVLKVLGKAFGKPMRFFTFCLLVVAALQWWVTLGQLEEMRSDSKQTDELIKATRTLAEAAKLQADAAKESNRINMESMRATLAQSKAALDTSITASRNDQRAWVVAVSSHLSQFAENREIIVDFLLTNTGKTPARNLKFERSFQWRAPQARDIKHLEAHPDADPNLAPSERRTYRFAITPAIPAATMSALKSNQATFSVVGRFTYNDLFGTEKRITPVCVVHEARIAPLLSSCNVGQQVK